MMKLRFEPDLDFQLARQRRVQFPPCLVRCRSRRKCEFDSERESAGFFRKNAPKSEAVLRSGHSSPVCFLTWAAASWIRAAACRVLAAPLLKRTSVHERSEHAVDTCIP